MIVTSTLIMLHSDTLLLNRLASKNGDISLKQREAAFEKKNVGRAVEEELDKYIKSSQSSERLVLLYRIVVVIVIVIIIIISSSSSSSSSSVTVIIIGGCDWSDQRRKYPLLCCLSEALPIPKRNHTQDLSEGNTTTGIYIPWPFPPVWGVADSTKEHENNGGFTPFF